MNILNPCNYLQVGKRFVLTAFLFVCTLALQAQSIYWTQDAGASGTDRVARATIPGSPPTATTTTLTTTNVGNTQAIFIDYTNGWVYFMEATTSGGIFRFSTGSSFPTSSMTTVVSAWPSTNTGGFTIDITGSGTIYWALHSASAPDGNTTGDQIRKSSMSSLPIDPSSGGTAVVTGGDFIGYMVLGHNGNIYWTDRGTNGFSAGSTPPTYGKRVYRASTGSTTTYSSATVFAQNNPSQTTSAQLDNPQGIAIDYTNSMLYWADFSSASGTPNIYRASLSGSVPITGTAVTSSIFTAGTGNPRTVAVDQTNGRLYFPVNISGDVDIERISLSGCCPISTSTVMIDVSTSTDVVRDLKLDFGSTLLPVDLLYYTAVKQGDYAHLRWATASETNNSHFEIERSINGHDWQVIGSPVKGHGTSLSQHDYQYTDYEVPQGHEVLYYRLVQVDFDGKRTESQVRPVTFNIQFGYELMDHPLNDVSQVNVKYSGEGMGRIEVFDLKGFPVSSEEIWLHEGANYYNLGAALHKASAGIYILSMTSPTGEVLKTKILKR